MYYLCDSRSIVGNCLQFWGLGGCGYTYNLDKAEVYSETLAMEMHKQRTTDMPYPKDVVDSLAQWHIDHQFLDHLIASEEEKDQKQAESNIEPDLTASNIESLPFPCNECCLGEGCPFDKIKNVGCWRFKTATIS